MQRNYAGWPGYFNTDFGVKKGFKITETSNLRFEANFFNIFNHPNFSIPDNNLNDINTTFGLSTGTVNPSSSGSSARVTQLALRFDF